MGLDMYLTAKQYISEYSEGDKELLDFISNAPVDKRLGRVKYLTFDVMYWRKANAIHKWFVDNVQEGKDECKEHWVSIDQLKALLSVCQKVLQDTSKAAELLPTQSGFFFGGTEYDEWYFQDVEDTVNALEDVVAYLEEIKDAPNNPWLDFYYCSSW